MIGFVFLSCLLFGWGGWHRVLLAVGWCRVLYSSGFLCGSSHYLILSMFRSSLVFCILESALPLQRLKTGQQWSFHRWFVRALNEIKMNTQKWETKDKPQTNGSYKIRQIIIKIMDHTYIHIHPWAKSKQSNKNKVQQTDPVNKENQKLYLPVKNKTN